MKNMAKITYENKIALNENTNIQDVNKCKASDLNEIKEVVNSNDDRYNSNNTYSTSEYDTGKKWIDGKKIYGRVINVGNLPNTKAEFYTTDILSSTIDNIIGPGFGFARKTGGNEEIYANIGRVSSSSVWTAAPDVTDTYVRIFIETGADRSSYIGYVMIEYTKKSD